VNEKIKHDIAQDLISKEVQNKISIAKGKIETR